MPFDSDKLLTYQLKEAISWGMMGLDKILLFRARGVEKETFAFLGGFTSVKFE